MFLINNFGGFLLPDLNSIQHETVRLSEVHVENTDVYSDNHIQHILYIIAYLITRRQFATQRWLPDAVTAQIKFKANSSFYQIKRLIKQI